jgi:O-acetyl-ADP-ribose deacetylase (regulator of RNase III)
VQQWQAAHEWPKEVVLVVFDAENKRLYEQTLSTSPSE